MVGFLDRALADWGNYSFVVVVSRWSPVSLKPESWHSHSVAECSSAHHSDFVRLGRCKERVAWLCMWACSSLLRDPINQALIGYSKPARIGISGMDRIMSLKQSFANLLFISFVSPRR